ncbi:MAG: phage tail protein [Dehalococcoidia bacterium]
MKRNRILAALLIVALVVLAGGLMPALAAQPGGSADSVVNNYSFRLEIDGVDAGQFASIEGMSIETEVIEYQNGDDPLTRKRPGRVTYGDITLKRGYIASTVLNDWIEAARTGSGGYTRKNISIVLIDNTQMSQEIKRWNCFETFPRSWKMASLDGKGNDVLTKEMVIAIEWFEEA